MKSRRVAAVLAGSVASVMVLSACGAGADSEGSGNGDGATIDVLAVNLPAQEDLVKLTEEHFTKETGIKVNFTLLPENDVRAKITQEFSSQAGVYDVATLSNYEIPFYADNGWVTSLDKYIEEGSETIEFDDLLPSMMDSMTGPGDEIYGLPFEGQSSFTMYRKSVFDELGLTMPDNPTWDEIADLAAQIDENSAMKGICLRGLPGWGQQLAPLNTVINTFGGTWFDMDWDAQLTSPEVLEAVNFYVDLIQEHGEPGAAQAGFTECLNYFMQDEVAIWVDATNAGGPVESDSSPIAGDIGYAQSPVKETDASGWLWTWAWGIEEASDQKDAAWEFISWASSREYEELVAEEYGWARVPYGKRQSTFDNTAFQEGAPFYEAAREAISSVDANNPGVQPRPYSGVQFVGVPEFISLGTAVSEEIAGAIAGTTTVEAALAKAQELAQAVG
ncbi:sugar ABC transporter substrate-binding protein, partial [Microbacterium sp.]|uniref:ABC transporter substrate-binding protein n=1 Tax=Microbacterium sp. TaxID=51671 RepID=UPI002622ADDC